ncbi:dipeptide/oligopeptide/nickel ABC transporter permease/ATP-binding protein [Nocardiopsis sediminis]|uniref:Dipeptide/oligopeptide/nickel ABC transporter permease/ATP-binding protein n=1 Tax=Nocardiopsis sediminis TaxID=1778267 RepID=A0ABV8FJ93_9ACTN
MSIETGAAATVPRPGAWRRFLRNPLGVGSALLLAGVVVMSVLAPWIAPHDPLMPALDQVNAAPNGEYLLGGDGAGRDVLSRLIWGGRDTLAGAAVVVAVAAVVGIGTGLLAAYVGRWTDALLTWVSEALLAIPSLIVLIALYAAIGPDVTLSMTVFGVLISPFLYRLVRAMAIEVKNEAYVEAAQVSGVSPLRIVFRHILVVIRGSIIVMLADITATAIGIQASLEFLGLGSADSVTWGSMVQEAFVAIFRTPLSVVWPGLLLTVTIGAFALLGNAVRDALVPDAPARSRLRGATAATAAGATAAAAASAAGTADDDAGEGDEAGTAPMLGVSGLTVAYPHGDGLRTVVDGVSFTVRRGEVLGLVGESGSGKSQCVYAVLGLLPAQAAVTAGRITLDGEEVTPATLPGLRGRRIAYVPQEPMSNLDPSCTVGHQLALPLRRLLGMDRARARARALELLGRVGIRDPERVLDLYPHQISGGMAQRVLIAGAISTDPDVIVADEPTTALDVTVQADILELLRDLQRERGMSVLLVTHDFGVVADLCDRVVVMRDGVVVERGDTAALFAAPRHEYTRTLLDASLEGAEPRTWTAPELRTEGAPR